MNHSPKKTNDMKNKLQVRLHQALISIFENNLFNAGEKAKLSASMLGAQESVNELIEDGELTDASCERIDADVELFIAATSVRTAEERVMACSILMLLFGITLADELRKGEEMQVAQASTKQPTPDVPQGVAPATNEPPSPGDEATLAKLRQGTEKYGDEQVLVITTSWLRHVFGVGPEDEMVQGYIGAGRNSLEALLEESHFRPRHFMEEDATAKQLIPYLVVINENNEVLTYFRGKAGTEDRLHAKLSAGFGGHINPVDGATLHDPINSPGKLFNPLQTVEACIRRELLEEIGLTINESSTDMKPKLVGYVNNDRDPVGQVHLGLIYVIQVNSSSIDMAKAEESVVEPRWRIAASLATGGLNHTRLEEWSRMIVDPLFGTRSRHLDRAIDDGPLPSDTDDMDEPLPQRTCEDGEACDSCQ